MPWRRRRRWRIPGRRRWRWRRWWRRRYYPRRRFRRRRTVRKPLNIIQYQPRIIKRCVIKGKVLVLGGHTFQTIERFHHTKTAADGTTETVFVHGGTTDWMTVTLQELYKGWKQRQNTWSTSNATFDMARYKGAKFTLWKHIEHDYVVVWDTEQSALLTADIQRMQPFQAQLTEKNHIVVRSNRWGNSAPAKTLRIKPPPGMKNQWYYMSDIADKTLVNYGFSIADIRDGGAGDTGRIITPWPDGSVENTVTEGGKKYTIQNYSWQWDLPPWQIQISDKWRQPFWMSQRGLGLTENNWIYDINIPYYQFWWGIQGSEDPQINTDYWGKKEDGMENLYPYKILWWDQEANRRLFGIKFPGVIHILQNGPMVPHLKNPFSHIIDYKFYWEWGGHIPHSRNIEKDPRFQTFKGQDVQNPRKAYKTSLAPWDFDKDGLITKHAFRRLLSPTEDESDCSLHFKERVPKEQEDDSSQEESSCNGESDSDSDSTLQIPIQKQIKLIQRRLAMDCQFRKRLRTYLKAQK
ncbi:ORF1 [Torque teno indri virus 1]|uniref:Capsid protein n=1 Tax=Torque teno indri virus 1 TaxID=2010248 RepID=A0A1Z1W0S6_9VIRU|nr:ORF1 [Torque teno indri virus 1]ARX79662.1 ORF1 [Torque teno indri virus 1]